MVTTNHKLQQEQKGYRLMLVGRNLTPEEFESVIKGTKSRGLREDFIREGH